MKQYYMTVPEMLKNSRRKYGALVALQMKDGSGDYRKITYEDFYKRLSSVGTFLMKNGVTKGSKVAILSENRPEWPITYFGTANIGATTVPLDPKLEPEEVFNLLENSDSTILFCSSEQMEKIEPIKRRLPKLSRIVDMDKELDAVYASGPSGELEKAVSAVVPDDIAAIIYTSGTTGKPKGVMLSQKNILSNVEEVDPIFWMIGPGDNFLSVLPNYHTFESMAMYVALYKGSTTTYAESLKSYGLLDNMARSKTSVMCAVPLLYRLFYDGIERQIQEKGTAAKLLFGFLFSVSKLFKLFGINAGKKLFGMVHKKFGGNIRFFISGGAALDPAIIKKFDLMGFTILQGYGLTETSPILSACTLENNIFGSVGQPLPGIEIKINEPNSEGIGEIIAIGPNVMKGYYKNKEATDEVIRGGWFHTGDLGKLDKQGNLYITGRCKDVIVLGSGINVYPDEVEFVLSKSPFISEICVFGGVLKKGALSGMEEVRAAILPDMEYFEAWAKKHKEALSDQAVHNTIGAELERLSEGLATYKRVMKYYIVKDPLPKTPTRKIKRFSVRKQHLE